MPPRVRGGVLLNRALAGDAGGGFGVSGLFCGGIRVFGCARGVGGVLSVVEGASGRDALGGRSRGRFGVSGGKDARRRPKSRLTRKSKS